MLWNIESYVGRLRFPRLLGQTLTRGRRHDGKR